MLLMLCTFTTIYGEIIECFDLKETSKGVIHITYTEATNKKLKVMIEKADKKYTYDLNNNGKTESFPLQLGNGDYKVKLLENTTGNNYRLITTQTVEVKAQEEYVVYLNAIQNINWTVDSKAVKKAVQLTASTGDLEEKAKILYDHMVGGYSYDYDKLISLSTGYVPVIDSTFIDKKGICYDFSSLYAAMLRSQGIPSKLIKGYTPNVEGYHAWNEVYDAHKKEWTIIDTTYDLQVIKTKPKVDRVKSGKDYEKVNEY